MLVGKVGCSLMKGVRLASERFQELQPPPACILVVLGRLGCIWSALIDLYVPPVRHQSAPVNLQVPQVVVVNVVGVGNDEGKSMGGQKDGGQQKLLK